MISQQPKVYAWGVSTGKKATTHEVLVNMEDEVQRLNCRTTEACFNKQLQQCTHDPSWSTIPFMVKKKRLLLITVFYNRLYTSSII